DEQHLGAGAYEAAVELWEAEVVADRESERAEPGRHGHHFVTGRARRRFADRDAAGEVDVEEMQFAVAGHERAARVEEAARVVGARLAGRLLEERAGREMDRELACERRQALGGGPGNRLGDRGLLGARAAPGEHLG